MTDTPGNARGISSELKLRIVSALVLAAIVLGATWIGGRTFTFLCVAIAILVLVEYLRMCRTAVPLTVRLFCYIALVLVIAAWLTDQFQMAYVLAAGAIILVSIWEGILRRTLWGGFGLMYAALPFFALDSLRGDDFTGIFVCLLLFACVWGADTFAYFCGRTIGGPKLAPRISPKKTWSGFIGGILGATALACGLAFAFDYKLQLLFITIVGVIAVSSQVGDLIESVIKRKFDVKDSGQIIPGHGGVLDRIDGLIVAGVVTWGISLVIMMQNQVTVSLAQNFVNAILLP